MVEEYGGAPFTQGVEVVSEGVVVTTLEGELLQVGLSQGGWTHGTATYETFEALMMARSPGFQRAFNNTLMARLAALA